MASSRRRKRGMEKNETPQSTQDAAANRSQPVHASARVDPGCCRLGGHAFEKAMLHLSQVILLITFNHKMDTLYTEEELEQLLHDLQSMPSETTGYDLGYDPTVFTPENCDQNALSCFSSLPSLGESTSTTKDGVLPNEARLQEIEEQLRNSLAEIESLKRIIKQLKTYVTDLHPWTLEVTDALDKLGDVPATVAELGFTTEEDV
ncbi:hypothetical protein BBP40_007911 [Aspergillus hancockii]|nr:hypothetical protein BBP40_007911 [Aspergillus hancockii]